MQPEASSTRVPALADRESSTAMTVPSSTATSAGREPPASTTVPPLMTIDVTRSRLRLLGAEVPFPPRLVLLGAERWEVVTSLRGPLGKGGMGGLPPI